MKKIQKKRKGFTLIELVVVIVIIAILAAVALLRFGAFTETAKDSRIKSEHAQLITAGNMWRAAQDDPSTVEVNDLDEIVKFMEETKEITADAHEMVGTQLVSTYSKGELKYDFASTYTP